MTKLIILSGIPGAGKSTWAKEFLANENAVIVSRDAIRFALVSEDMEYFSRENEVTACFYAQLNEFLASGKYDYVVADATHNTKKARNTLLDNLTIPEGVEIIPVNFYVSIERAFKQNKMRSGRARVPEYAIENMFRRRERPTHGEKYEYAEIWNVVKEDDEE